MKVWYETILEKVPADKYGRQEHDLVELKVVRNEPCCKEMDEHWYDWIGFDDKMYGGTRRVSLKRTEWEDDAYKPIEFCPWCAAKVEAIESRRVRRVARTVVKTREVKETEYDEVEEPKKEAV